MDAGPSQSDEVLSGQSRRQFLRASAAALAGAVCLPPESFAARADEDDPKAPAHHHARTEATLVIRAASEGVISGRVVQPPQLRDLLRRGLMAVTGKPDLADAWHTLLRPDDRILIKFSRSAAVTLGTTPVVAAELLKSLVDGGWDPGKITLLEVTESISEIKGTRTPDRRWQGDEVEFGLSGRDSFLAELDEATAIINVPFLKSHHRATMSGALKNLSHGLIRHPARFHANGCDPAIGEIVASAPIRSRLKLTIVNALRLVFDKGPEATEDQVHNYGALLFGTDPVACDAVGYGVLNEVRAQRELAPLLTGARVPRQLVTAARLGLGVFDTEAIRLENR